jgi:predicted AAA+ superfamily ATPase
MYPAYLQTYVERDVRQLINVGDLNQFQRFIKLCAGRIGQLLNISELAMVCGISGNTAQRWISTLEASYTIFLLQPHFTNFNKRVTKSPKLYFYDTGLACSLLDIPSVEAIALNPYRGHLFENFIIADFYKQYCNLGKRPPIYFWRDMNGRIEVDCILQQADKLTPIEIKSGETVVADFFTAITAWGELTDTPPEKRYVIYGGDLVQQRPNAHIMGWQSAGNFVTDVLRTKV